MALRPARPCLTPGCPNVTRNGPRCDDHRRQAVRDRSAARGTRQEQGYGPEWQRNRAAAIAEQGYCSNCGAVVDLTGDHVVPKARGGTADPSNIAVLCRPCNSRKGDR